MSDSTNIIIPQFLPAQELHTCMGLNSCKDKGFSGKNACAGQGDCSTINHPCHVLNECKGQGGCGLFGTTKEFCHPGENDCRYQGSCGAPILASRFIVQGPNKGRSVWQLARELFLKRMEKDGIEVEKDKLPVGQDFGPTDEYAGARGAGSSCGQSGERYCSYAFENRDENRFKYRQRFMKRSARKMDSTEKNCGCGEK